MSAQSRQIGKPHHLNVFGDTKSNVPEHDKIIYA